MTEVIGYVIWGYILLAMFLTVAAAVLASISADHG